MLSKLTNKTKIILVGIAALLFFPIAWNLSFSKSFDTYNQLKKVQKQIEKPAETRKKIDKLQKELTALDALITNIGDSILFQEYVLGEVSQICERKNNLTITHLSPVFVDKNEFFEINNLHIDIKGGFHELLELLFVLEVQKSRLNIASLKFELNETRQKKKELYLRIYFQNYLKV